MLAAPFLRASFFVAVLKAEKEVTVMASQLQAKKQVEQASGLDEPELGGGCFRAVFASDFPV